MTMNASLQSSPSQEQVLHPAVEHHCAGRFWDAEVLYGAVLGDQPKQPEVNHNPGELLQQRAGVVDAALGLLKRALEAVSTHGQYWGRHIDVLLQAGPTRAQVVRHSTKTLPCI
jgi:hypothetical protein